MNKFNEIAEGFCKVTVYIIFTGILIFLYWLSIRYTCTVYGVDEIVNFEADRPLIHIALLGLLLMGGRILKNRDISISRIFKKPKSFKRVIMIAAGLCGIWILLTRFWLSSDQRLAFESAQAFVEGNYMPWMPVSFQYGRSVAGYAYTYPSQNGLILFFAMLAVVFDNMTPYVVQFLNILFLISGIICLARLYEGLNTGECKEKTTFLILLCLPFTFYITFVYGTIPGFACASAALYYEYRFLKDRRWLHFFISVAAICGAVLLKSNYLIVLAALVIYLLTGSLFQKTPVFLGAAVLMVVLYIGSGKAVNLYLEKSIGMPVSEGIPMLAWVEMGLQDGSRAPGWYNGYNVRVFEENDADSNGTQASIEEDLRETIKDFSENPKEAKEFFIKKAASIWAEPTFQSLWIQEVKGDPLGFSVVTQSLFKQQGLLNEIYVAFFNLLQSLVYMGTLLFLYLKRRSITWMQLMPAVVFIGGFLFHMVWEAKGQYSVCYFILLIPYAAAGMRAAAARVSEI